MDTFYIFCGEGLGVPGLPHRVSKSEAQALGVLDLLEGAINNGNYKPEVVSVKRITAKGAQAEPVTARPDKEN